jgi:hypothetical protein
MLQCLAQQQLLPCCGTVPPPPGTADTADLSGLKRQLLGSGVGAASGKGINGAASGGTTALCRADSAAAPLDVTGVVFHRLPISHKATPVASLLDSSSAVVGGRRASNLVAAGRGFPPAALRTPMVRTSHFDLLPLH